MRISGLLSHLSLLLTLFLLVGACKSGDADVVDDEQTALPSSPTVSTERTDDGLIIEYRDTNADGHADILRYYEEYQHPRDESLVRRRLRKMEIDVTGDQKFNVRRHYDEFGNVVREENDLTLDGQMDSYLYFIGGELARKELMDETGQRVRERRIYLDGELVRVERDRYGDDQIDRWEYYQDGVLIRIGLDTVGDGAVDTWQLR